MTMKAAVVSILLAGWLSSVRAEWRLDAQTGFFYNSNLSNSDRASDVQSDWSWQTDLRAGRDLQLTRDLRLMLGLDVGGDVGSEYSAFSNISPGGSVGLRYRFGLGRQAPWIMVEEKLHYAAFDENVRNGWDEVVRLRGGLALSDRVALEVAYSFRNFAARDNFFDEQSNSVSGRLVVDLNSSWQVSLGYSYRDGTVISYAVPPRPDILQLTTDRRVVTTFGDDPLYTGYRLNGQTNALSISTAYAVTKYLSVGIGYEYASTWHDPLRYENHLVQARVAFAY
jgi:hypothetical protein